MKGIRCFVSILLLVISLSIPVFADQVTQGLQIGVGFSVSEYNDGNNSKYRGGYIPKVLWTEVGLHYDTFPRRTWHIQANKQVGENNWATSIGMSSRRFADNANTGYWLAGNLCGGYIGDQPKDSYYGGRISGGIIGRLSVESNTSFFAGVRYGINREIRSSPDTSDSKSGLVGMEFTIGGLQIQSIVTISLENRWINYSITSYF